MKSVSVFLTLLLFVGLRAAAVEVTATPGGLAALVSDPATVTELKVAGTVDASDLFFVDSEMTQLRTLDLSAATVAAYSGERLRGYTNYAAGEIPARTFAGNAMTKVVLPAAPVTLADGAFAGSGLTSLSLTPSVKATGLGVFSGCPALAEASTGGATLGTYTFAACPELTEVSLEGNTTLPEGIFEDCAALATVRGSEALVSIGAKAFDGCAALGDFTFGAALASIGDRAFASTGLTAADMTACRSLRRMGSWVFADCRSLEAAFLPSGLTAIGKGTFFDCTSLREASFSAIDIADYTFKDAPLSENAEKLIPQGVTTIGDYALKGADEVSVLKLPSTLESIGDGAMEGMTGLTLITAEELGSVPALGQDVWSGVDQHGVELRVAEEMGTSFASAPQWQDFRINAVSTAVPGTVAESSLRARFDGMSLMVRSSGTDIASVTLYDLAGNVLMTVPCGSDELVADTSHLGGNIFIVRVVLADGRDAALKMLR